MRWPISPVLSLMPLEVSRFAFCPVTLNCQRSSDLISMHDVMPWTLASPVPGPGPPLASPRLPGAGVGRSALPCLEHLQQRRSGTHTRALAVSLRRSRGPAAVCQPRLVGRSQLGLAGSRWHTASRSGRGGCDTPLAVREVPGKGWRSGRRGGRDPPHGTGSV